MSSIMTPTMRNGNNGELSSGTLYRCAPGSAQTPREVVSTSSLGPLPIRIPSTVASACTDAGVWHMENPSFPLDEFDWWVHVDLAGSPDQRTNQFAAEFSDQIGDPDAVSPIDVVLRAEGLATLTEVWLHDDLLAKSNSMFVPLNVPFSLPASVLFSHSALPSDSRTKHEPKPELWLCFRSVSEHLRVTANRRDRPAWKSRLVDHQGLRRVRTSLLGRMPGWSPPVPAIGPYRLLHLSIVGDLHDAAQLGSVSITTSITTSIATSDTSDPPVSVSRPVTSANVPTKSGVRGSVSFFMQAPSPVTSARLRIHVPFSNNQDHAGISNNESSGLASDTEILAEFSGVCARTETNNAIDDPFESVSVSVSVSGFVDDVALWWPHTHGDPWLYPVSIVLSTNDRHVVHQLAPIGFRSITVDTEIDSGANDGFGLAVNGVPVYARGACWTPVDLVSLNPTTALLDDTLDTVVAAGMNMIRVGGTMTYETDCFHQRCDELGIMVWQDFMFANLDIPLDNEDFLDDIRAEVTHHALRLGKHASTVVLCGGSEVDQQASMMGIPAEQWNKGLARSVIAPLCAQINPAIAFVVSSPSTPQVNNSPILSRTVPGSHMGAALRVSPTSSEPTEPAESGSTALPFHVDSGVGHYYGVGAYLREFDDARRAKVRFAAECLAFANVPENPTLDALFGDAGRGPHQPLWKQRVPRDNGAGWDFDDVRDHYLGKLFDLDPMHLRYADLERWLDLARITSSEVFDTVASEWRRGDSTCNGSLVWFLRDLWTGAGWGLIDALGSPKPALSGLARRWQPLALTLTDEGTNGLDAHLINETPSTVTGMLEAVIVRDGTLIVERAERAVTLSPRSTQRVRVDELFNGFRDLTWAYRFGPAIGELVRVRFRSDQSGPNRPNRVDNGPVICDAHHWITARPTAIDPNIGLTVHGEPIGINMFRVTVGTEKTAFGVHLDGDEVRSSDNWFHLAPGDQRVLTVSRPRANRHQRATPCTEDPAESVKSFPTIVIRALNSRSSARVTW